MTRWSLLGAAMLTAWCGSAAARTNCQYPDPAPFRSGPGLRASFDQVGWRAALDVYWACRAKEDKEEQRQLEAAREKERTVQEAARKAARQLTDQALARAKQGVIEAHGDVALGAGGPRNAAIERVGSEAIKAKEHIPQSNGIASALSDIAIRSGVDVTSRAMGSFEAGMNSFGGMPVASPPLPSPLLPSSFARVGAPASGPDLASFAGALGAAARDAGARGASDMQAADQQLGQSGLGERVGASVRRYNASIERSSDAIAARMAQDTNSLNRFHEVRDEARANAAARSASSASSGQYASAGVSTVSRQPAYTAPTDDCHPDGRYDNATFECDMKKENRRIAARRTPTTTQPDHELGVNTASH